MAISFVGAGAGTINASAVTYAFSSLVDSSGATPTLQQNDLVVITTSYRNTSASYDQTPTDPSSVAYTAAFANIFENNSNAANVKTTYKFMGASPDASVTLPAAAAANWGAFTVHVFRGVNTTTPLDVTPTTTGATGATHPDAPSITPVTSGAWVYVLEGTASGSGVTSATAPPELDTTTNTFEAPHNGQANAAAGIYSGWTSGAFSPSAFGGYIPGAGGGWGAASVALRPASTGGGTTYNDTISESIISGDSVGGSATYANTLSEGITAGDSDTGQAIFRSPITYSITASDSYSSAAVFRSVLSESFVSADNYVAGGAQTYFDTLTESCSLLDSWASAYYPIAAVQIGWTLQKPNPANWSANDSVAGTAWTKTTKGQSTW